jgi:GT2 family glycosyltransferase
MELIPNDNDWVCFTDRDVMFLTPDYGHQMVEIISQNPLVGLFTCQTNRIGCKAQLYQETLSEDPNILTHAQIAKKLQHEHRHEIKQIDAPVSGFLFVIQKKVWKEAQFNADMNMLGVDWDFSRRISALGLPIVLMKGIYVFHFYRLNNGSQDVSHLSA